MANYDGVISELRTALQKLDAKEIGDPARVFPTTVVVDCARDVVQEWEPRRAEGSGL